MILKRLHSNPENGATKPSFTFLISASLAPNFQQTPVIPN
jgi:hypothetical protein